MRASFAAGMVAVVACHGVYAYLEQRYVAHLQAVLYDAGVHESVVYRGHLYEVRGSSIVTDDALSREDQKQILRRAYALRALRANPPIALPGVDLDTLQQGTIELHTVETTLAESHGFIKKLLIQHSLFPDNTLRTAGEAERARRSFLASSDRRELAQYLNRAARTSATYWRESILHELAYRWFVTHDSIRVVTEQHSITKQNTLDTFRDLRTAGASFGHEVASLSACLTSIVATCDPSFLMYPDAVQGIEGLRTDTVTRSAYPLTEHFYNVLAEESGHEQSETVVVLERSWCLNPELEPMVTIDGNQGSVMIIEAAADVRMIRPGDFVEVPFFRYFLTRGIAYVPSTPFSHYTCVAMPHDIGAAYATRAVWDYATVYRLSDYLPTGEEQRTLQAFESSPVDQIFESQARMYVRLGMMHVYQGTVPYIHRNALADLALQFDRRTRGSERFVSKVVDSEQLNSASLAAGIETGTAIDRVYFSRSAFVSFSMLIVPRVSPGDVHEPFSLPIAETPYVYLSTTVDEVPMETVVDAFRSYYTLH